MRETLVARGPERETDDVVAAEGSPSASRSPVATIAACRTTGIVALAWIGSGESPRSAPRCRAIRSGSRPGCQLRGLGNPSSTEVIVSQPRCSDRQDALSLAAPQIPGFPRNVCRTCSSTRQVVAHSMVRGAMRRAARSASAPGNASAIAWARSQPRRAEKCRGRSHFRGAHPPAVRRPQVITVLKMFGDQRRIVVSRSGASASIAAASRRCDRARSDLTAPWTATVRISGW